jgi:branched-subunit amino acid ABC-type transport system permease component
MDALVNIAISVSFYIALLLLLALGLAVMYGLMRVINFAHGEFIAVGAFVVLVLQRADLPLWAGIVVAPFVVALMGLVLERVLIRHLYGRLVETILVTFGLSIIIQQLLVNFFGTSPSGMKAVRGSFSVGDYRFSVYQQIIVVLSVLAVITTYLVFTRTLYGLRSRAAVQSPDAAAAAGIDVSRSNMRTFVLGSALAGFAGALIAPIAGVQPFMGQAFLARVFTTVIVGGPAALSGTTAASGLLGGTQYAGEAVVSPFVAQAIVMLLVIAVVRWRPRGLSAAWRVSV